MDFMTKYSKQLSSSSNNIKDEEPKLQTDNKPSNFKDNNDDTETKLKTKEKLYQKMIIDQLNDKKVLKVNTVRYDKPQFVLPTLPELPLLPPNYKPNMSKDDMIKECKDIRAQTSTLQDDANNLVSGIKQVKDETMGFIQSYIDELTKRLQDGNFK
ncbi:core wall protein [Brazilian porcupinepox virus 1]|nr:core wall protein [Brazilian porcupinepox virus 1]